MSVSQTFLGETPQEGSHEAALQALVEGTRRRLEVIEKQHVPSTGDGLAQHLIEGVYAVILVVTVATWAVLGFVVWVPLLVRHTIFLAGTVFYGSLIRDQIRVAHAQHQVQFAARFYARGFEHFFAFYRQRREPETPKGLFEPLTAMTRGDLLVDCVWVGTVWIAVAFSVNAAASALFWLNRTLP